LLLSYGASVYCSDVENNTPFHWAARKKSATTMAMLLKQQDKSDDDDSFFPTRILNGILVVMYAY
jgi:ankyrin repeat protein